MTKSRHKHIRQPGNATRYGTMGYCDPWMEKRVYDPILHRAHMFVLVPMYNRIYPLRQFIWEML